MRKIVVLAAGMALSLAWAASAAASDVILFDPNGIALGGPISIDLLDQAPGNALAVGASAQTVVPAGCAATGTCPKFTLLYQANLGVAQVFNPVTQTEQTVFTNGVDANPLFANKWFTFVAGFQENITANTTPGNTTQLTFGYSASNPTSLSTNPANPNFFFMYDVPPNGGSNLTGVGFVPTAGGVNPILSGHTISTNFVSNFAATGLASTVPACGATPNCLDQNSNGNQYPGISSLNGAGSTKVTIVIDAFNSTYFPNLVAGTSLTFFNTSQVLPFDSIDPSACFSSSGNSPTNLACALLNNQPGATLGSVGTTNGFTGPNTILQVDANESFQLGATAIPEPVTLTLLGVGLFGTAVARRRQIRKGQQ